MRQRDKKMENGGREAQDYQKLRGAVILWVSADYAGWNVHWYELPAGAEDGPSFCSQRHFKEKVQGFVRYIPFTNSSMMSNNSGIF